MKIFIFVSLFLGFSLLFHETRLFLWINHAVKKTMSDMDASARQRTLTGRKRLISLQEEHSILCLLERQLRYSGLRQRFSWLTAEWWIAGNLVGLSLTFTAAISIGGIVCAGIVCALLFLTELGILGICRTRNLRRVNESLLKLLDFLGNYSITAGELTGILEQVSRYMEEPIRGALEACCCEAKMTGDIGLALLSMAESIEHPKFKELARNMEISVRYCADFSAMVSSSRRSMREYLRILQERKGMLREALLNMIILLAMSFVMLAVVSRLVAFPFWSFLCRSLPGRTALATVLLILCLFASQAKKIQV